MGPFLGNLTSTCVWLHRTLCRHRIKRQKENNWCPVLAVIYRSELHVPHHGSLLWISHSPWMIHSNANRKSLAELWRSLYLQPHVERQLSICMFTPSHNGACLKTDPHLTAGYQKPTARCGIIIKYNTMTPCMRETPNRFCSPMQWHAWRPASLRGPLDQKMLIFYCKYWCLSSRPLLSTIGLWREIFLLRVIAFLIRWLTSSLCCYPPLFFDAWQQQSTEGTINVGIQQSRRIW